MIDDVEVVKIVIELLDWYLNGDVCPEYEALYGERVDAECFLREAFKQWSYDERTMESVTELFFKVLKYEKFFTFVMKDFYESRKRRFPRASNDFCLYCVFLYYAIFELNEETLATVQTIMMSVNAKKALALSEYMKKSSFPSSLFASAVQIWDFEYVKSDLLSRIRESTFKALYDGIHGKVLEMRKIRKKELTKPVDLQVLKRSQKPRAVTTLPKEEVEISGEAPVVIKPTRIPLTTYKAPDCRKKLDEIRVRNQEKAKELYEEAQKKAFRVAKKSEQKKTPVVDTCKTTPTRRSKIPVMKVREPEIQPKTTAAVILRDGARLMKIEQEEMKRLEDIMRGAFNSGSLKALEKEIQEERTRKHMEDIEKKHLQGLLTYEEALLAKRKYLKKTKKGADEFRKEKEAWMKQLEEWRAEEQIRIRESVERGKLYEKGGREAVEHVKEEKHRIAMETMEESRCLKEKWLAEREEELKRKIQIIKEIKALQAFGVIKRREAVANAAAGIGLLCEMSTEELKERLMILRMEVKEEIDRRREEFKQRKECRRAIVEGYRDLIEQHQEIRRERQKMEEPVKKPKSPMKSSSVEALKKKLEERRTERLHHSKEY